MRLCLPVGGGGSIAASRKKEVGLCSLREGKRHVVLVLGFFSYDFDALEQPDRVSWAWWTPVTRR